MRIIWSRGSQDDVLDIAEYYDRFGRDVADEVVRRIEDAPPPLADFARLGQLIDGEGVVRKRTVAGTPYVLLYVVGDDRIEVRRVVHVASDWRP